MLTTSAPAPSPPPTTPLGKVVAKYHVYVGHKLDTLTGQVTNLRTAVAAGHRTEAQRRWLVCQVTWQQVGAAYGSFGAAGTAINGLASGLPQGVASAMFTGLHRIEYGLYNNEDLTQLVAHVDQLASDVSDLITNLGTTAITPTDMPIRCHEILEDALRDHLSGQDDYGSGMAYALTSGDVAGTRVVLQELKPLIPSPVLGQSAYDKSKAALDILDAALLASKVANQWPDYPTLTKHQRQPVNGAIGGALEALYQVPFVLGKLT
ncbi:MAG: EfeM/EfeO family lipoprotein [Jatrophihabitans sp.]